MQRRKYKISSFKIWIKPSQLLFPSPILSPPALLNSIFCCVDNHFAPFLFSFLLFFFVEKFQKAGFFARGNRHKKKCTFWILDFGRGKNIVWGRASVFIQGWGGPRVLNTRCDPPFDGRNSENPTRSEKKKKGKSKRRKTSNCYRKKNRVCCGTPL